MRDRDKVGDSYRYEWEAADGSQRFGFEGELLESDAPHRAVTTERMIGTEGPGATNLLALTPVEGGTLTTLVITYPYIANSLVDHRIGLEETDDGIWSIYFNTVLIATLDERDYIIRG